MPLKRSLLDFDLDSIKSEPINAHNLRIRKRKKALVIVTPDLTFLSRSVFFPTILYSYEIHLHS